MAKLETQGGHIKVLDVSGDLDAYTAGGHVLVGNITGNAKLRTGGGHIRAGHNQRNSSTGNRRRTTSPSAKQGRSSWCAPAGADRFW